MIREEDSAIPEQITNILIDCALTGGKFLKSHFLKKGFDIQTKSSPADLVTEIDLKAQNIITDKLSRVLPNVQVVGEEGKTVIPAGEAIYLDPIDGTLNFVHGFNKFSVSIGYWIQDQPVAGVVYNPIDDELFHATRGRGAFKNGNRIQVSTVKSLNLALLSTGWPYDKSQIMPALKKISLALVHAQEIRTFGSSSLSLCYLSEGVFEGFWEWNLQPWDLAAGVLIALEAGGKITALSGEPFQLNKGAIVASNGHVHAEMLNQILRPPVD
ncbi:MAG: inositol monophosphatase [Deltaproteobacteria bacterium]|nr:MAG: inositol monophosphatase [Deltaproteobacteria bacterium]